MDFKIAASITTMQDFKDFGGDEELNADKIEEFRSIYNDKTKRYYVRYKSRDEVRTILNDADIATFGTDYVLIDNPAKAEGGTFGVVVLLDPTKHLAIEQAIYDNDATVLEGDWSTIAATKERLEN